MTQITCIGASAEASGHPTSCDEPVSGSVSEDTTCSVTINSTQIATTATASISFSSHAHSYSIDNGCYNNQSHTITPDNVSSSITVNGSPVFITKKSVATDPTSGGSIDITTSGGNNSVNES